MSRASAPHQEQRQVVKYTEARRIVTDQRSRRPLLKRPILAVGGAAAVVRTVVPHRYMDCLRGAEIAAKHNSNAHDLYLSSQKHIGCGGSTVHAFSKLYRKIAQGSGSFS
jgi:hypothetical protein